MDVTLFVTRFKTPVFILILSSDTTGKSDDPSIFLQDQWPRDVVRVGF